MAEDTLLSCLGDHAGENGPPSERLLTELRHCDLPMLEDAGVIERVDGGIRLTAHGRSVARIERFAASAFGTRQVDQVPVLDGGWDGDGGTDDPNTTTDG
jgi:hypothetical protein